MQTLSLQSTHSPGETKVIVEEALKTQRDFAYTRFLKFEHECQVFEHQYGMDSEQFLCKFESGELGDEEHWFDWYAVVRGKKLWEKKYHVLQGLAWNE
jgi:hypothetical protein